MSIEGLRAADAPLITECCGGDRRLLLRLGSSAARRIMRE